MIRKREEKEEVIHIIYRLAVEKLKFPVFFFR